MPQQRNVHEACHSHVLSKFKRVNDIVARHRFFVQPVHCGHETRALSTLSSTLSCQKPLPHFFPNRTATNTQMTRITDLKTLSIKHWEPTRRGTYTSVAISQGGAFFAVGDELGHVFVSSSIVSLLARIERRSRLPAPILSNLFAPITWREPSISSTGGAFLPRCFLWQRQRGVL